MENWNKHEWQGRSRQNVNFSSGVSAISIFVVLILVLIASFTNAQTLKNSNGTSLTPTLDLFKGSQYINNTYNRFNQRSYIYLNRSRGFNNRTIVMLPNNNRRFVYNNYQPVIFYPINNYNYGYFRYQR